MTFWQRFWHHPKRKNGGEWGNLEPVSGGYDAALSPHPLGHTPSGISPFLMIEQPTLSAGQINGQFSWGVLQWKKY